MVLLFAFFYLFISFFLTIIGIEKQHEGTRIFIISLLLTPLVGLFYLLIRKRNITRIYFYYCPECDYIFPTKMKNCPMCEEEGFRVRLKRYISPYNVNHMIRPANIA